MPAALPASGRRRPALVVIGALLALVAAFATIRAVVSAGQRVEVLAVARDVPAFTAMTSQDLRPVFVAVDAGVRTVPASDADQVVGRVAATDLAAGSLLSPDSTCRSRAARRRETCSSGCRSRADQLPAGGVTAGDRLRVVEVPAETGAVPDATAQVAPRSIPVEVVRLGPADANGVGSARCDGRGRRRRPAGGARRERAVRARAAAGRR